MSEAKLSLAILQRISEFLSDLPEDHLADLAEGRARLTFIPAGETEPRRPAARRTAVRATVDMTEARDALQAMDSRDSAHAYLNRLRLKPDLTDLAKLLDLGSVGGLKKMELIEVLVERTVGNRLNSAAIRQL